MRHLAPLLLLLVSMPVLADSSAPDPGAVNDKLTLNFGGFIDTYYGYDFNAPKNIDRTLANGSVLGTQFVRSNEFNVNLAFFEAKLSAERVRGRLALQTGTSVQANYAGEIAALGVVKGPFPAELMQEATVGYRIANGLWIDGGIYFSHIGFENFVSRDNWNYTRSLMAEYSPYYETGVKLSWQISSRWAAQLHVLNGWQNIYENNQGKALGMQLGYSPSDRFSITYSNFLGDEAGNLFRTYHDLVVTVGLTDTLQLAGCFDLGTQAKPAGSGTSTWYTGALFAKWQFEPTLALGARLETYFDRNQVIIATGTPDGMGEWGPSINFDAQLHKNVVWRTEARYLLADNAVFASSNGPITNDKFVVTSLGLSF